MSNTKQNNVIVDSTYNGFRYICAKNYFGAYVAYVDVQDHMFLSDEDWYDRLPFHKGCTFSGTYPELSNDDHWFIGCDWAHNYTHLYGTEDCTLEDVESNIKYVIDNILELVILYTLETGKAG